MVSSCPVASCMPIRCSAPGSDVIHDLVVMLISRQVDCPSNALGRYRLYRRRRHRRRLHHLPLAWTEPLPFILSVFSGVMTSCPDLGPCCKHFDWRQFIVSFASSHTNASSGRISSLLCVRPTTTRQLPDRWLCLRTPFDARLAVTSFMERCVHGRTASQGGPCDRTLSVNGNQGSGTDCLLDGAKKLDQLLG